MNPKPVTIEMLFQGNASASEWAAFSIAAVYIVLLFILPTCLVVWDTISRDQPPQVE